MQIGLISDTHGLIRPEAVAALGGSALIIHAGDIGGPAVLDALGRIAPLHAVRGNVDRGDWARGLPASTVVRVGGRAIYVLHELKALDLDPQEQGYSVVVSGHSHRPSAQHRGNVLYINPGSAGPRRFSLPVACARLFVSGERIDYELLELTIGGG